MIQEKRRRGRPQGSGTGAKDETLRNMQAILDFVRKYHKTHPYAPTLKEIAVGIGKKETDKGNIQPLITALVKQGFLTNAGRYQSRSIALAPKPPRRFFYKPD